MKQCTNAIKLLILCLGALVVLTASAIEDGTKRLWNLQNVDIRNVIEEISQETGRNFLIDPRVNGKINMVSSRPMDANEIYQVFLSMLQVLGYGAVDAGEVTKIILLSESRQAATPVGSQRYPHFGDELVVQVIPLRNVTATKVLPVLRPLIPETGNIAAYDPGNSLIVSASADKIKRITELVRDVDRADTNNIEIISLRKASATQVVSVMNTLQNTSSDGSNALSVAADEHTNSIVISGSRESRLKARVLIARLDAPASAGSVGNTQVIYLHYLKAKELAPILSKVAQSTEETESGNQEKSTKSNVVIEAEPSTNSIILTAPPSMMSTLKGVVNNLDQKPAQVLVEAAIVEVDETMRTQLGVLWGQINREGFGNDENDSSTSGNGLPTGFNPGIGVIKNGDLREVIYMLAQDSSADILSTPSLVVLDNQQAKIEVGKTLSIETGSYADTGGANNTVTPFTTFERDNIGLHLYVTPQINRGDAVQLMIDQGNETLEDPVDPTTTPVTNKTALQTVVLVSNKDILVLGGLISNKISETHTKIPLVGDIPLLGHLFKYTSRRYEKKNLMIFLKPTIIRQDKTAFDQTARRYNFIRNEQLLWENREKHKLPYAQYRVLPMWQADKQPILPVPFASAQADNLPPPVW